MVIGVAECLPGTFAQLGDYYNNCTCRVYIKEGIEIEDTTCKMLTLQEQREREESVEIHSWLRLR